MGVLYLDGRQIGDDGRDSGRSFAAATPRPASITGRVDIDGPARRLSIHLAKSAARRYQKCPQLLDMISMGLSDATPQRILAVVAIKAGRPVGGNPLGALVIPVNLRGAQLYARWLRRFEERDAILQAAE